MLRPQHDSPPSVQPWRRLSNRQAIHLLRVALGLADEIRLHLHGFAINFPLCIRPIR